MMQILKPDLHIDYTITDIKRRLMSWNAELLNRMRKASKTVYVACRENIADDISLLLNKGADRIEKLQCDLTLAEKEKSVKE